MKNIFTYLFLIGLGLNTFGQAVNDSISMQQFYTTQVFYSLDNGEIANINNNDWDLGFSNYGNGSAGSAIILNEANTTLWAYPGDTANWSTLDTAGHNAWDRLLNTDTSWTNGAFNVYRGTSGMFDMGWGVLNPQNNYWTFGDSLYVVKLSDNSYQKLWILSLKSGVWNFKYANLDGSNEQNITIDKSNYTNRNFIYHSMLSNQTVDREPDNTTWDIQFTKHVDYLSYIGQYVSVTGVFNNRNIWSAKSQEVDYATASTSTTPQTAFNQKINNIGRGWKKYSSSTGWTVYDSTAYFVYNNDSSNFYRIVFTAFGGMGTGKAYFNKELLTTVSVNELNFNMNFSIYPNPASEQVTLLLDYPKDDELEVTIYHLSGKMVYRDFLNVTNGVNQKQIPVSHLSSGSYIITIGNQHFITTEKLIIR